MRSMVRDILANAALYYALAPNLARALRFLADADLDALVPDQRRDLGGGVFATAHAFETRRREAGIWEAHRQYIDVQYVHAGVELMGYAPLGTLAVGADR